MLIGCLSQKDYYAISIGLDLLDYFWLANSWNPNSWRIIVRKMAVAVWQFGGSGLLRVQENPYKLVD